VRVSIHLFLYTDDVSKAPDRYQEFRVDSPKSLAEKLLALI
jgi:hypothetical protein